MKFPFLLTVQHQYVGEGSCWPSCHLACLWVVVSDLASLSLSFSPLLSSLSLQGVCVLGTWCCHIIFGVCCFWFWDLAAGKTFGICKWPLFLVWSQSYLVLCLSQYSKFLPLSSSWLFYSLHVYMQILSVSSWTQTLYWIFCLVFIREYSPVPNLVALQFQSWLHCCLAVGLWASHDLAVPQFPYLLYELLT